jgi:hypothetical protein
MTTIQIDLKKIELEGKEYLSNEFLKEILIFGLYWRNTIDKKQAKALLGTFHDYMAAMEAWYYQVQGDMSEDDLDFDSEYKEMRV